MVAGLRLTIWLSADGEVEEMTAAAALARTRNETPIVNHATATAKRLETKALAAYDLLELFAFVRPAQFCLPTPGGLAVALNLSSPGDAVEAALTLQKVTNALLNELSEVIENRERLGAIAFALTQGGWRWGPPVLTALGMPEESKGNAFAAWQSLPEREYGPAPSSPSDYAIGPDEAQAKLAELIGVGAESRPQQFAYAAATSVAFTPRREAEMPRLVLAEAGTGVGKTLGYIAPASL